MKNFTIYSEVAGKNPGNTYYPTKINITDEQTLSQAVSHDYVCAEYRDNFRGNNNFLSSDVIALDVDNDHSENVQEWVRPQDISAAFPAVSFAVHYSRSHMKKNSLAARPKFHVFFPIEAITNAEEYSKLKHRIAGYFSYFDKNALDAGRFFFGTEAQGIGCYLDILQKKRTDNTNIYNNYNPSDYK